MNLNVLKWRARKLRPLLRPICWLTKHKRGVLKHNFPWLDAGMLYPDARLMVFECPRCLRMTRYQKKGDAVQTSPSDGSEHYAIGKTTGWTTIAVQDAPPSPHSAAKAYHADELKKLRGEA